MSLFELRIFSSVQTTIKAELKPNLTINIIKVFQGGGPKIEGARTQMEGVKMWF